MLDAQQESQGAFANKAKSQLQRTKQVQIIQVLCLCRTSSLLSQSEEKIFLLRSSEKLPQMDDDEETGYGCCLHFL